MQPMILTWQLVKRQLAGQKIARSNAAEASAAIGERRHEQEDVDAYLARATDESGARRRTSLF